MEWTGTDGELTGTEYEADYFVFDLSLLVEPEEWTVTEYGVYQTINAQYSTVSIVGFEEGVDHLVYTNKAALDEFYKTDDVFYDSVVDVPEQTSSGNCHSEQGSFQCDQVAGSGNAFAYKLGIKPLDPQTGVIGEQWYESNLYVVLEDTDELTTAVPIEIYDDGQWMMM